MGTVCLRSTRRWLSLLEATLAVVLLSGLSICAQPGESVGGVISIDDRLSQADEFLAIGNFFRAASLCQEAFILDSANAKPLIKLAVIAQKQGDEEGRRFFSIQAALRGHRVDSTEGYSTLGAGVPERIVARYLGFAESAGPRGGSIDVGEYLKLDQLLAHGFDGAGRPVPLRPEFSVSSGLLLERTVGRDGSPSDILIRAGKAPSREEWIEVRDLRTAVAAKVTIRVFGKVARIQLSDPRVRRSGDLALIRPGDALLVHAVILDDAGNRLHLPRLDWRATLGGESEPSFLQAAASLRPPSHFFEPHRNRIVVMSGPREREEQERCLVIEATSPGSGVWGRLEVKVDEGAAALPLTPTTVAFHSGTFESAMEKARREAKIVFAVVAAHW